MSKRSGRKSGRYKNSSRAQRWLLRYGWVLPIGAIAVGLGILLITYAFASIPLPRDIELPGSAQVFDRNGKLIGTYAGEQNRFLLNDEQLHSLPDFLGDAVIASEDRDFYNHGGVSVRGMFRAAWANLTGGHIQQGGSTITQQYVKNAVLQDPERTITRKIKEAILAIKLEQRYSKDQILGFYLNTIYLGRGAYGVEAAARTYFNVHARQLTLPQAAFLAGIIPAPESYQPDENPVAAKERRDHVLNLMQQQGYINASQARRAKHGRIEVAKGAKTRQQNQTAAYFMEWLRRDVLQPELGTRLYTGGLRIYTTLDLTMQQEAETAVSSILTEPEDPQASLVSVTPRGEVRAFVGGRDFTNIKKARGFDYAADPPGRPAGSAFKPFTLMTALKEGISTQSRFSGRSPATITDPACFTTDPVTGVYGPWHPENFANEQFGTVNLDQATTNSINTVYAQLIAEVGPDKVADTLKDFGFDGNNFTDEQDDVTPSCSLALGTLDVTPVQMARAYAGFSAGGRLPEIQPLRYITDSKGNCIHQYRSDPNAVDCAEKSTPDVQDVADPNQTAILTQTLTHVVQAGTGVGAALPGRLVAGKTGTTQNHANAWFAGYVPQLTTVVWMGYPYNPGPDKKFGSADCQKCGADDFIPQMQYCADTNLCRPVHGQTVAGGTFPAPIWAAFMSAALADQPVVAFPTPVPTSLRVINSIPPPAPAPSTSPGHKPPPSHAPPSPSTAPSSNPTPPPPSSSPGPLPSPSAGKQREGDP